MMLIESLRGAMLLQATPKNTLPHTPRPTAAPSPSQFRIPLVSSAILAQASRRTSSPVAHALFHTRILHSAFLIVVVWWETTSATTWHQFSIAVADPRRELAPSASWWLG